MSSMTDQGDNKDALLEKLDGLIQSGRARKRRDAPPVLTDAIPTASESDIPTLTDAVEMPATSHTEQPAEQPEQQTEQQLAEARVDLDTPLDFEPAITVDSEPDASAGLDSSAPLEPEPETGIEHRQEGQDGVQAPNPADLQDSISAQLVAVIEREMTTIIEQIPAHKSKLTVLQRSLRFALPELVRLRLQEDSVGASNDNSDDPTDANS